MKKTFFTAFLFLAFLAVNAQDETTTEETTKGFKKENLFTGGDFSLAFGSGRTAFGVSPYFGYSINKWLDAAISLNYNYISERDYPYPNDKLRQTTIGPGAFVRLFPVKFLFAQAQYEHNFLKLKYIPDPTSGHYTSTYKVDANSLLVGVGYASSRYPGNNNYYYFSIMYDVLKLPNSPYVNSYGRGEPIIKAGYNIALFQGRQKNY